MVKNPLGNAGEAGDSGLIPGREDWSPRRGNGTPLQYSCLENSMDRGAWQATVQRVAKSRTRLSDWTELNWRISTQVKEWLPSNYVCLCVLICVWLFVTPWTEAYRAPLSMEFSRQENWGRLPLPPPGDLLDPGIEPMSPASRALVGGFFTTTPPN